MRTLRHLTIAAACAASIMLPLASAHAALARPTGSFTTLKVENGWVNGPRGTSRAQVADIAGIVTFKGAISSGHSAVAFTLPTAFRPAADVYVPVNLCGAANGRLYIQPSGVVTVEAEKSFTSARCFTSLDGASFAKSAAHFTALTLQNGWVNAPFGTANATVANIAGIVHFKGAISSGGGAYVFTLPAAFRPAADVYVPVDLCDATNGRLFIAPTGVVIVQTRLTFSNAQCFTSLDGASFAKSSRSFTLLKLRNGWRSAPFSTSSARVAKIAGIVRFNGAISSGHSSPFTLPRALRPARDVYITVDLCNSANGRLFIRPNGVVSIEAEGNAFHNAHCFTSLDGASFKP